MNFPVLFRTIDGASQATIETQYATEVLRYSDWYGKCRRPRFSFFMKDINLWFVLTHERVYDPMLRGGAGRPATDYRPVWVADRDDCFDWFAGTQEMGP